MTDATAQEFEAAANEASEIADAIQRGVIWDATANYHRENSRLFRAAATLQARNEALTKELTSARTMARLGIEGDNHHNAAMCPYCVPSLESQREQVAALTARAEEAETERDQCLRQKRLNPILAR